MTFKAKMISLIMALAGAAIIKALGKAALIFGTHAAISTTEIGLRSAPHALSVMEHAASAKPISNALMKEIIPRAADDAAASRSDETAESWASKIGKESAKEAVKNSPDIYEQLSDDDDRNAVK